MTIHLHWGRDPQLLRGVIRAIAMCGARNLLRKEVTAFREDVTSKKCLQKDKLHPVGGKEL